MKRMLNEATDFREEMIDGFVGAYSRHVRRVPNASGIAAVNAPAPGRVAVVVGGGSGHYPAFYGLVGRGMASAGVIGDIFTSPSGEHAYRVAKAVDGGAGVLFTFGNYSGDVMNFGMAETRLQAEGISASTVLVTDDVLSAPPDDADKRRGIAGGFYVFKAAGASAARGDDLETVAALTRHANDQVRTAGVGFAGCTVPGQSEPLFTVNDGLMEVGLGIHGEAGVRTQEQLPAREIAAMLVEVLLAEAPPQAGSRAAVLVNGLGGTKYEELFVLYQGVEPLLRKAGIEPYEPYIGEFVTALDMAGCSLSLFWLDDDLQPLLDATAVTPAFTKIGPDLDEGHVASDSATRKGIDRDAGQSTDNSAEATPGGEAGRVARECVRAASAAIHETEQELGRLDAAAGDGDHGAGMARGFRAAVTAIDGFDGTARESLRRAGNTFMDSAGGASGALVGAWIMAIGAALPESDDDVNAAAVSTAMAVGLATIQRLGQAQPGDKTLIDTLHPFGEALATGAAEGSSLAEAWSIALSAAEAGMTSTIDMVSQRGRASRLGERSRGHQDAGATSIFYVLRAAGEIVARG